MFECSLVTSKQKLSIPKRLVYTVDKMRFASGAAKFTNGGCPEEGIQLSALRRILFMLVLYCMGQIP
jgi:hypothetical protein